MKFLVFSLVVIANFSANSKASVDSVNSASDNALHEYTRTERTDSSCYRPCKLNLKPRRCRYKFKIEPTIDENGKASIAINDMIPGPSINVCVNDIIIVEVENGIPDQDLTIHFHGINQKGTPFMDGVPMVSQCPIGYGSKYKYAFKAMKAGTYFYHADSVLHQSDGVFGSLIISQPPPFEPHVDLYDYDRSQEQSLIITAVFPQILTGNLEDLSQIKPEALNINGEADITKIFVIEKFSYRLRLLNAIGIDCPVVYNIEGHDITVIATDGNPVKPVTAKNVLLYPGERMDIVVQATQAPNGFWMYVRGYGGACAGLEARAMLLYSGFNYTAMLSESKEEQTTHPDIDLSATVFGQNLESLHDIEHTPIAQKIYLGIDKNTRYKDVVTEFRYQIGDSIPKLPFFPAPFSLREDGVVQINNKSFLYPNSPILLTPENVPLKTICKVGEEMENKEPQCVQILNAKENEVIELALVNEGFSSNDTFTFHLHGYNMQVVATWQNPTKNSISKETFLSLDKDGKIHRKTSNPPLKDTVVVPNKGFTIVRIKPDHPGAWMLECRACALYSLPTALLISVPQPLPNSVLDALPKCGNYKPPDVLLT